MAICAKPQTNVNMMAYVGSWWTGDFSEANSATRRDMMAVGPIVISFDVPNKQ